MSRIEPAVAETATPAEAEALDTIKAAFGAAPNLWSVVARSSAMTTGLLGLDGALKSGVFSVAVAEQLAIAVAHENRCPYCLAAHTAVGRMLGLDEQSVSDARAARSSDPKVEAALQFVLAVVRERGFVSDAQLEAVREAGWDDGAIVELVGHAIENTFTNYLYHVSEVPVDFPEVAFAEDEEAARITA
ncbi:MAG TPA: carboxymuconolactone decarboxylase family protein [Gaiellaceae bacterium]|nr:carboxymuconolactone decarboxylase family protein [Gaiellaceae bacterium]